MQREHVYVEFLHPAGKQSDPLPAIYDELTADDDVTVLGEVDPQTAGAFRITVSTGNTDLGLQIIRKSPGDSGWYDWPGVQLRSSVGNFVGETEYEPQADLCQQLVDVARDVYLAIGDRPTAGFGRSAVQEGVDPPIDGDDLSSGRSFLTWLDVFTRNEVEKIGRETLLDTPATRVEELNNGAILVCSKHPLADDLRPLEQVADHLGIPDWQTELYS